MSAIPNPPQHTIARNVREALREDLGDEGDISTALLAGGDKPAKAEVLCRTASVICGKPWFEEVFRQLPGTVSIHWICDEGQWAEAGSRIIEIEGPIQSLLTGERTALNFLQLLSGTATRCRQLTQQLVGLPVTLLDTRKTIPGLRVAQKYAIRCGGGCNHRMGLNDAYLIKENHLKVFGTIAAAVRRAREQQPQRPIQVEVCDLEQLQQAIDAGVDQVLLDNFDLEQLRRAVQLTAGRLPLEASGGIGPQQLRAVAETGVQRISLGLLTKDLKAADLSLLLLD